MDIDAISTRTRQFDRPRIDEVMLIETLLADLSRQYIFEGCGNRKVSKFGIIKGLLKPRFLPVVLCRLATYFYVKHLLPLAKLVSLVNFILFGIEIALRCEIGKGLYFPHTVGTVIGALRIGENAVIYHGVTLGAKTIDIAYNEDSRPIVGSNVVIGSGAKVLGGISIGSNVVIGANAVVTKSIPDNVKVGGIPAKVLGILDEKGGPNE